jgi:outer membrane receptor protein involved in Fe transport
VANLYANYQVSSSIRLSARIDNLLDRQYHTFGTYGEPDEVLGDVHPEIEDEYFIGPASPRVINVNIQVQF